MQSFSKQNLIQFFKKKLNIFSSSENETWLRRHQRCFGSLFAAIPGNECAVLSINLQLHNIAMNKDVPNPLQQAIGARYCPEAVDSAEYVVSCPSSMIGWNTAAKKKNCSRMAMHQNCSSVEQFQYHCVINGYRSKMVEVCAPSRIIIGIILSDYFTVYLVHALFANVQIYNNAYLIHVKFLRFSGHCVEFNHLGGVIQDQLSSPCHITFPKCDGVYKSTAAYKCTATLHILYKINLIFNSFMRNILHFMF